jgi:hypothetical protein
MEEEPKVSWNNPLMIHKSYVICSTSFPCVFTGEGFLLIETTLEELPLHLGIFHPG